MSALVYVSIAVVLYSFMNVGLEQKLGTKYNAATLLICCYAVMFPLALMRWWQLRLTDPAAAAFPTGTLLLFVLGFGVTYFFADLSYISAFTAAGGDVLTVTMVMAMTPVFSSVVKYIYTGGDGVPNRYQVAGYVCAAAAVYLAGKGVMLSSLASTK